MMKSLRSFAVVCLLVVVAPWADAQVGATWGDEREAEEAAAQRAREAEARRLGDAIVDQRQALAGREFGPGYRETVKRNLLDVAVETLRQIEGDGGRGDIRAAMAAARSRSAASSEESEDLLFLPAQVSEPSAVSGVAQSGTVFVPVTPCRIIDTRLAAGGALVPGSPRSFVVTGSNPTLFGAQGGSATGCGIPTGTAVSAFVNFAAVSPTGTGNLRSWAYAASLPPPPLAATLNYASVLSALANGVTVPLCDPLATTCNYDILAQAFGSETHLVADVMGYYRSALTSFSTSRTRVQTVTVASTCTWHTGAAIVIDAPAPGKVLVRANVRLQINHTVGAPDIVRVGIGSSPTDCNADLGDAALVEMTPEPSGVYYPHVPVSRLFTVAAPGTYVYYVTGSALASADDNFNASGIQATYLPD